MYSSLEELTKQPIFHFFSKVSKIPRGSGQEQAISDYLVHFARARGLEVIQDEALNVIIKSEATPGYEHVPTVIIQGHMDMVCEKNKGTDHDFTTDPIQLKMEGDMLYASETTLGADNGVAVAYVLALLDADEIPHPALEVVITTEEETSMKGALTVDPAHFTGKLFINLDAEKSDKLLVSGAGGLQAIHTIPVEWQDTPANLNAYRIRIMGLKGGHSGIEIDKGRGNSNKLLGRILYDLAMEMPFGVAQVHGGMFSNAIPRETEAMIALSPDNDKALQSQIKVWNEILKDELSVAEPDVCVTLETVEVAPAKCFAEDTKRKVIASLMLVPNGIQRMSMEIAGLVESSINLGVVRTTDTAVRLESDARSSVKSRKKAIVNQAKVVADSIGCEFTTTSDYPEWPYDPDSKIRELFEQVYREREGVDIPITAVHAGFESGIFVEKIPGLDAISIGPDIYNAHTPKEHVNISSMEYVWAYFLAVLKEMKAYDW
ncbi:aminoacyl-histidine dipeptidase [Virgibacillus natechei]